MERFLTLKDHVYNYIVDQINNGDLKPGQKVNENNISEKLNISRTPVREALIQLVSEDLLESAPRKGFIIKHLTNEEAKEMYVVIGIMDGAAASLAAPLLNEKNLSEMDFYIESMDLAIQKGNYDMYYKMQEEFHGIYLSECPNKSLVEILLKLKMKLMKKNYDSDPNKNIKEILLSTNEEHRVMLDLMKRKENLQLEKYLREVHWNPQAAYLETL